MRFLLMFLLLFIGCEDDPVSPVHGCFDSQACNYNPEASIDNNSCTYADENYDCDGNCTLSTDCLGECGGSAVEDNCGVCSGDGSSCGFRANITLTDNSIPLSGADVFIRYKCFSSDAFGECWEYPLRATQTILYEINVSGNVKLDEYDLDDNLIRSLVDGVQSPGTYNISNQPPENIAPFGLSVLKIVLEVNNESKTEYSVNWTAPDFNLIANLGQTNESGQLVLNSDFLTSYNIPTFYNVPTIQGSDEWHNPTDEFSLNDLTDGFEIYFLYQGNYKYFDIDLQNGNYNYSFEWNDGEDFNPPRVNLNNNQIYRNIDDDIDPPDSFNLNLYPNPY